MPSTKRGGFFARLEGRTRKRRCPRCQRKFTCDSGKSRNLPALHEARAVEGIIGGSAAGRHLIRARSIEPWKNTTWRNLSESAERGASGPPVVARARSGHAPVATEVAEHAEIVPMIVGASGRGRLVLACGAVVAMLGGPVSADECSDHRAASVLYHAADKALTDFRDTLSLEDMRDSATMGEKLAPYHGALNSARRVREEAAIALRFTIDDEIAATAIDAILSAWVGIEQAYERVSDWNSRSPDSGNVGSRVRIAAASFELQEAAWKAGRAYYFALRSICLQREP